MMMMMMMRCFHHHHYVYVRRIYASYFSFCSMMKKRNLCFSSNKKGHQADSSPYHSVRSNEISLFSQMDTTSYLPLSVSPRKGLGNDVQFISQLRFQVKGASDKKKHTALCTFHCPQNTDPIKVEKKTTCNLINLTWCFKPLNCGNTKPPPFWRLQDT